MDNSRMPPARPLARWLRQFALWAGEHPLLCASVFFVLTFTLRLLWSCRLGPILMLNHPDELRYLHLAKSIAEGGPLLIQGLPAQFQKILYSLLISPAFLLARDPVAQVNLVGLINCILMASMMFPLALLAGKLSKRPSVLLLTLAFGAALPDFIFTATFMTETVYWPVCVWVFYFFHCAMAEKGPRKRLLLFALLGFFIWLAYLTKEIGAAFLIAAVAVLAYEGIRDRSFKQNGLALAVCLSAFFVPYMIVRQALFPNLSNSYSPDNGHADYDHLSLSALSSPGNLAYLLYFAAVLVMAAILSFYILPVLLPLFGFRKLNGEKRRMYLFGAGSLLVTVGGMVYTIRESWGYPSPMLHLRLLAPIAVPFVILCFDQLLSKNATKRKKKRGQVLALTAAFCTLMVILLPSVPTRGVWIDRASLSVSHMAYMLKDIDKTYANSIWRVWLALMLALAIAGVLCFIRGKKKTVLVTLLCTITVVSVMDNVLQYRAMGLAKQQTPISDTSKLEERKYISFFMDTFFGRQPFQEPGLEAYAAVTISNYFQQAGDALDGNVVLFGEITRMLTVETYLSQRLRLGNIALSMSMEDSLAAGHKEVLFDKEQQAHYFIVTEDFNPFANVEVIFRQAPLLVLRNLDPTRCFFS